MFRRFSTKVGLSSKDTKAETNGTSNGASKSNANGVVNGVSGEKPALSKRLSSFSPKTAKKQQIQPPPATHGHSGKREDVESSFKEFAQLVHASQRPLPTQTGDGTYIEHKEHQGMFSDLRNLGFKDAATLMSVMKTKASGELADDRTYLMEKVIQVKQPALPASWSPANCFSPARRRIARVIEDAP